MAHKHLESDMILTLYLYFRLLQGCIFIGAAKVSRSMFIYHTCSKVMNNEE